MRKIMNALLVTLVAAPALVGGQADDAARVLADMRTALGGADKVAAVKTLTAVGTSQRVTPQGTTEGEMELAMELPDKYVARTVLQNRGNMSVYRNAGFSGSGLINEIDAPPDLTMAVGRDRAAIAMRGGRPGESPTPEQRTEAEQRMVLAAKRDFARLTLGLLGSSYEAFPLQFSYAGQAAAGDDTAHVIEARGDGGFEARLFVDVRTSLPLMLSWSEAARGNPDNRVEHRIYYSNFKRAGDLHLPHTLQRSIDGKPFEETTFEQIRINPKIDSRKFAISK